MELITTYLRTNEKRFIEPLLARYLNQLGQRRPIFLDEIDAVPTVNEYVLSYRPAPRSLSVERSGEVLREGSDYHINNDSLVLSQMPERGETLEVRYMVDSTLGRPNRNLRQYQQSSLRDLFAKGGAVDALGTVGRRLI